MVALVKHFITMETSLMALLTLWKVISTVKGRGVVSW